jgi:hypothetical protein
VADDEPRQSDSTAPGGEPAAGARSLIVGLRVFLLVAAACAVVVAVTIAARGRADGGKATIRYACPMHAEVRSAIPGECPICRMALERVGFVPGKQRYVEGAGTIDLHAIDNVKKHNIIDFVRRHALLPVLRELRGPAWVDEDRTISAIFYNDQIAAMAPDEAATFLPGDGAGAAEPVVARRTIDAPMAWDRSTSRLLFRVAKDAKNGKDGKDAKASRLAAGQVGWLEVAPLPRAVVGVAASAVLQSPEGPYVLAWTGHDYTFVKRPIEIGETFHRQGFAVVLAGLQPNDRVIARATFFVDADRRLDGNGGEIGLGAPPTP